MTANYRTLENRLSDLEQPTDVNELPLASFDLLVAADRIEETPDDRVVLLDGEPHRALGFRGT